MKLNLLIFSAIITSNLFWAQQTFKFLQTPKFSIEDLRKTKSLIKEDAPAEILYRSMHYKIGEDYEMEITLTDRIKIFNKDKAEEFLNKEIGLYQSKNGREERLISLKAFTYNLENDKVVPLKVEKDSRFRSVEDKRYQMVKFAFPGVKDGSVVEYSYTVRSPFLFEIPKFFVEEHVPIVYTEYVFDAPKELGYSLSYQGSLTPTNREIGEKMLYGRDYRTTRLSYENLKPSVEEKFLKNSNNYKTAIREELNSTYINNVYKSYSLSWTDVRKELMDDESFGQELKKSHLVKDLLPSEIKNISNELNRAEAVLKFVQKKYTWDRESNVFVDKGIKNLINTGVGNSAEINLLLILMLREANVNAHPVVLSTVNRGVLTSYSPSIARLNYVIAEFENDKKIYLLDATSKLSSINIIPPRAVNYSGVVMNEKEAKEINIVNPEKSNTFLEINAKLLPDATFEGDFKDRDTHIFAMLNSEEYDRDKEQYYKENYKERYRFPFTDIKSTLSDNREFETSFNFTSDTFVDVLDKKMIFNPLLFLYTQNHDFNQTEERANPIEFISAYKKNKKVNITIPDGFKFENIPTSKKFKTDDDSISYSYIVTQEGNKITIETSVLVDDSFFPKEYYPAFKQIFDAITKLEGQLVTVVKK